MQIARVTRRRWVGRLVTAILVLFDRRLLDLLLPVYVGWLLWTGVCVSDSRVRTLHP